MDDIRSKAEKEQQALNKADDVLMRTPARPPDDSLLNRLIPAGWRRSEAAPQEQTLAPAPMPGDPVR